MTTFTLELPDDIAGRLDTLAVKLDRSRDDVAIGAIDAFVTLEAAHIAEIEAAIAEADNGDFVTHEEVMAVVHRFQENAKRL